MPQDSPLQRLRAELARLVPTASAGGAGTEDFVALLGVFLANVPDFIVLLAPDGTMLFLNRARPGKTMEEVVGQNLFDYMPDDAERMREAVDRVVATGESIALESSARYTDGTDHAFLTRISPVFDGSRVVALAIIATDVTAQKQAQAALEDSEEKLRLAVDATGMGLWSWDLKRDVVTWDRAMCRLWGVAEGPRDFESYLQMIHPDDQPRQREVISCAVETGEYSGAEYRIVRRDGTVRRALTKASATRDEDGKVARLLGGVIDVTEQRELEERSRQAQKLEAIGQLAAGIAHNFNNMLMAIVPNIELAMRDASPDSASLLHAAHGAGSRAAELVRQLTTFAGRARTNATRVSDARSLAQRTVEICRRGFSHTIEIVFEGEDDEQPVVSDTTQLEQVLLNLLINARDAVLEADVEPKRVIVDVERIRAERSQLSLGLEPGKKYVRIRVADNGIGMDAATCARIYEPFFTTKEVGKGTGLGLSTARTIVREHGGVLECTTQRGVGTTFWVFLPLADGVSPREEVRAPSQEAAGSATILVVDDEASVRNVTSMMLTHAGYTVFVAASGREALELLDGELADSVDLVLLDLSMPRMPGDAVRAELLQRYPRLKVAYFSGHALDAPDDVVGVVEKPIPQPLLLAKVREFLGRADD
ncbi:MAG: PAS domain S-box protein [Myxococcales bacterium]|jgi:PAS domain S-box-containing protein